MAHRVRKELEKQIMSAEGEPNPWEAIVCIAEFLAPKGYPEAAICVLLDGGLRSAKPSLG